MSINTIHPSGAEEIRRRKSIELIDVRTPAEYRERHAGPARLVPLESLDPRAIMAARDQLTDAPST